MSQGPPFGVQWNRQFFFFSVFMKVATWIFAVEDDFLVMLRVRLRSPDSGAQEAVSFILIVRTEPETLYLVAESGFDILPVKDDFITLCLRTRNSVRRRFI